MSTDDDTDHIDDSDDEILAAEYVLGVLPSIKKAALAQRIEIDRDFARLVIAWETRLDPLAEGFEPQDLPPAVKAALDRRLFGVAGPPPAPGFWDRLAVWRGLTGVATAALLVMIALPFATQRGMGEPRLLASLTTADSGVNYMVIYDPERGTVGLAHVSGQPQADQDFQLWIARGNESPVSLGVIPGGVSTQVSVSPQVRELLNTDAHMAISAEPLGGSPTGQPTGAVVAVGDLYDL